MRKLQLGIMAIASIAGVGIAVAGFTTPKAKFATITVYAFKNISGIYTYYTQWLDIPIGATCKLNLGTACTFTTTLSIFRLNNPSQTPNYTTDFPAEQTLPGQHPYVNYLPPAIGIYKY